MYIRPGPRDGRREWKREPGQSGAAPSRDLEDVESLLNQGKEVARVHVDVLLEYEERLEEHRPRVPQVDTRSCNRDRGVDTLGQDGRTGTDGRSWTRTSRNNQKRT